MKAMKTFKKLISLMLVCLSACHDVNPADSFKPDSFNPADSLKQLSDEDLYRLHEIAVQTGHPYVARDTAEEIRRREKSSH